MLESSLFVGFALLTGGALSLAAFAIVRVRLMSPDAIRRDGLNVGMKAPAWSFPSVRQKLTVHSPPLPHEAPQVLLFVDHSLKSFPSLIKGLLELRAETDETVDAIFLVKGPTEIAKRTFDVLGLSDIPIVAASDSLYSAYNVRVMPFAIVVNSTGTIRGSSLVNHDWQIRILANIARIDPSLTPRIAESMAIS